jgi:hypothetical protein
MSARLGLIMIAIAASTVLMVQNKDMKSFEAVIRGSTHVTVFAKSFYDARDKIRAIYCGGTDCISEGPWESH